MEQPSQTLYLNNLNEKIKKNILKKTLYALFSQFGKVIEIVACKGIKLRGQVSFLLLSLLSFFSFLSLFYYLYRHGLYIKILLQLLQLFEGYKDLIYMINH